MATCGNCWDHCSRCFKGEAAEVVKSGIPDDLPKLFHEVQKVYEGETPQVPFHRGDLIAWHAPAPARHCGLATGVGDSISQFGYSIEHWRLRRNANRSGEEEGRFDELQRSEPIHNVVSAGELHDLLVGRTWKPADGKRFYFVYRVKDPRYLTCGHLRDLHGDAPPSVEEKIMVAHWIGTITGRQQHYAKREPGGFGLALSLPNRVEHVTVEVKLREERDPRTGAVDTVVELVSWNETVNDLYYQNEDGSRVAAGEGGSLDVTFNEHDLAARAGQPDSGWLDSMRDEIVRARERLDAAEQQHREAAEKALAMKRPEGSLAGMEAFESGLQGFRQALARDGAHADTTLQAQRQLQDALTSVAQAFQAELEAEQKKFMPLVEGYNATLTDPNASDADKLAATEAVVELSRKMQEMVTAATARWDWPNAWYELAATEAALRLARDDLQDLERRLAQAQARPPAKAHAQAGIRYDTATGKRVAFVDFSLGDLEQLRVPIQVIPLKLEGFTTVLEDHAERREIEACIPLLGRGFKGEAEVRGREAVITYKDARAAGEPGLIGGGEGEVRVEFTRIPAPVRYSASVASVSEIPAYSLPALDMMGLQLTEQALGHWDPAWVDEYATYTDANPIDAAFSDRKHFRFMHVLSAYVETGDGITISGGDFLVMGPNGEQTAAGESVALVGAREFQALASSMKITVDGVEVMIFEQVYGAQTLGPDMSTTIAGGWFPPIWTALRIGVSADGRIVREMFDYSYFPQHFVFEESAYRWATVEEPVPWGHHGWGKLQEGPAYFMFDPIAAEDWWRGKQRIDIVDPKASVKGNPWGIEAANPLTDRSPAVHP